MKAAIVIIMAALFVAAPAEGSRPVALSNARHTPDWIRVLGPGETISLGSACGGRAPSDVQAYTARGRALRQRRDDRSGGYSWDLSNGRVVAGYVKINRDFFSFALRRSVVVAAWCG